MVPAVEYEVENEPPFPDEGEPPGADQLYVPVPADAVKLAFAPVFTDWVGGEQVGAGGGWTLTVTLAVAVPLTLVQLSVNVVVVVKLPVG